MRGEKESLGFLRVSSEGRTVFPGKTRNILRPGRPGASGCGGCGGYGGCGGCGGCAQCG